MSQPTEYDDYDEDDPADEYEREDQGWTQCSNCGLCAPRVLVFTGPDGCLDGTPGLCQEGVNYLRDVVYGGQAS